MITAGAIFSAIVGGIKAIPILDGWFQQLIALYVTTETASTLSAIADAAALAARAQTDTDRYAASAAWQKALQSSRVSS